MADIVGPLRPSDSWSSTEVRSSQHSHVWTVKGFSQCECRYLETSVKFQLQPNSSAENTTFRIRLHPQGNKESNKDFTFFQVFNNNQALKFKAKFFVYNSRNEEITTTVYTGTQQLHGYFEYIRRDLLLNHILPSDELQLVLNLTSTFDTVTKSSQSAKPSLVEAKVEEVARDMENFWKDGPTPKLSDFTIALGTDVEIPVHKAILAARSPVFAAMLEPHTEEAQSGRVQLDDVDPDVMQEMLHFLYSGRCTQLAGMASELLALADRFALPGLKDMADQVLRNSLSTETVCRILVLADMHAARDLKREAVNFIAQNSAIVIQTDGWNDMVKSHADLVTEVVSAISNESNPSKKLQLALEKGLIKPGLISTLPKVEKRALVNNVGGLKSALERLSKSEMGWTERLDLVVSGEVEETPGDPTSTTSFANIQEDDFKRELIFFRQAQNAATIGVARLRKLGIPTRRPDNYFAQMAKSDKHMTRVREKLVDIQAAKKQWEGARRIREERKYASKVQKEVLLKQAGEKRKLAEAVKKHRKGMKEQLEDVLENRKTIDDEEGVAKKKPGQPGSAKKGPKESKKRAFKNSKFGFGGRKKGTKGNNKESFDAVPSAIGASSSKPGRTKGKGRMSGKKKRPGKSKRAGKK